MGKGLAWNPSRGAERYTSNRGFFFCAHRSTSSLHWENRHWPAGEPYEFSAKSSQNTSNECFDLANTSSVGFANDWRLSCGVFASKTQAHSSDSPPSSRSMRVTRTRSLFLSFHPSFLVHHVHLSSCTSNKTTPFPKSKKSSSMLVFKSRIILWKHFSF